ncbi:MAG: SDR family NAD(P)-dependent oxidoreductase [Thermoflexibacteraceae bacterium]
MYALITGASKGIGKAMAEELAARQYNLVLVARSAQELQNLAKELTEKYKVNVLYYPADLSVPNVATQIRDWCVDNKLDISILINNAGYGLWGWFDKLTLDEQRNMMQLNMTAVVDITYLLLPILQATTTKTNQAAYIMNVASTAAYQAVPTLSVYAATKAFVVSFTRGLRFELQDTPVSVTCLSPGATDTNFADRAKMGEGLKATAEKYNMSPTEVAKIAINGMFNKEAEVVPGFINAISVKMTYFSPKSLIEKIAAGIYIKHLQK